MADGATLGRAIAPATGVGTTALGAGRGVAVGARGTRLAGALGRATGAVDGLATGITITGGAADGEGVGAADFGAIGVGAAPLSSAGPAARGGACVGAGRRKVEGFSLGSGPVRVGVCARALPPRVKAAVNASTATA